MIEALHPNQRRLLQWLVIAVVVGLGMMVFSPQDPVQELVPVSREGADQKGGSEQSMYLYERRLEERVTSIVRQIAGAGDAVVLVVAETGGRYDVLYGTSEEDRTTRETERDGRVRQVDEQRRTLDPVVLRLDAEQKEAPFVLQQSAPVLRGVLIAAEGAGDPAVRYRIARAVQTALQIDMHRIEVVVKKE